MIFTEKRIYDVKMSIGENQENIPQIAGVSYQEILMSSTKTDLVLRKPNMNLSNSS